MSPHSPLIVALLLGGSGACALVYQVAWLRLLRLVFGGSTAASATVLAIFMGGLGLGGLLLGRYADRHPRPLQLYARLELGIAALAALSPLLILLVRTAYLSLGGVSTLGGAGSTVVRVLLSALVLGLPTLLMGGTLPAAVRAVEDRTDAGRRRMGLLYGANTIGAVLGTLWATFLALEAFGTQITIWWAAALNTVVALIAGTLAARSGRLLAADGTAQETRPAGKKNRAQVAAPEAAPSVEQAGPFGFVLGAAALVGFAFLLMELVWYRMLGPLLGGSAYTFGLILSVALAGIGAGGLLYAGRAAERRPTLDAFAATCALEALFLAFPYALGDRIALLAAVLRDLVEIGFAALICGWFLVAGIVILPAAVVAGYQFPLLVGLLGSGERRVGRDVGATYAANTLGAIAGSLAGGFGLLPLLSAPGAWRATVGTLILLSLAALAVAARERGLSWRLLVPLPVAGLAAAACWGTLGPTSFWRHTPIGAGRIELPKTGPNDVRALIQEKRAVIEWQVDGVESAVALQVDDAYSFLINGKSDGNALGDAPMQVMGGLMGAALHPDIKRALVIGLGTGSTAGWLAKIPSVERVDVAELEPAVLRVAEACRLVNQDVLSNPKVHVFVGDGRELLFTSKESYDLILSEPSNPYRAGVASLFSREFYEAVAARLGPDGVFVQWLQTYEVDPAIVRTVYATLGAVFPSIETWEANLGVDLVLLARLAPAVHDASRLRARAGSEPYRSAMAAVWGVSGAEGFYSGFAANDRFAAEVRGRATGPLNTDDRTLLEFEFARMLGRPAPWAIAELRMLAYQREALRPPISGGTIDWNLVEELRSARAAAEASTTDVFIEEDEEAQNRILARSAYAKDQLDEAGRYWFAQPAEPMAPLDLTMVSELLAAKGDERTPQYLARLRLQQPAEAEALMAFWYAERGEPARAAEQLAGAFRAYRGLPWSRMSIFMRGLNLAWKLGSEDATLAPGLFEALGEPFAVGALNRQRLLTRANLGLLPGQEQLCLAALEPLEPHFPWDGHFLKGRADCYARNGHPLAKKARAELATFTSNRPPLAEVFLPGAS
jgi:spermidine synthase